MVVCHGSGSIVNSQYRYWPTAPPPPTTNGTLYVYKFFSHNLRRSRRGYLIVTILNSVFKFSDIGWSVAIGRKLYGTSIC